MHTLGGGSEATLFYILLILCIYLYRNINENDILQSKMSIIYVFDLEILLSNRVEWMSPVPLFYCFKNSTVHSVDLYWLYR